MEGHLLLHLVFNFLMQLFPFFVVHFLNAFCYGKEIFPKRNSQNEIAPLLIAFHLPYSKYKGVKMFLLVSLSKSKFFTRVALVSFVQHSCRQCSSHVAPVSLVSHSCCIRVARVWHSCCKLDQIGVTPVTFEELIFFLLLGYYKTVSQKFVYILVVVIVIVNAVIVLLNVFQLNVLPLVCYFNVTFHMVLSNNKRKLLANNHTLARDSLTHNVPKWSDTISKSCSKF